MADILNIEDGLLKECTDKDVESVVIPDDVTVIGESAFEECESLSSVVIPSSVTEIGKQAFMFCESLSSVEIPSSVTTIGDFAFNGCKSLSSVEIPSSVTAIGERAFKDCNINELSHPALTIKNGVAIKNNKVLYCASQSTSIVTIPEGVTEIGESAFSGCKSLASVEIPSSVTEIGTQAFEYCKSLSSVEFGGTVAQWEAVKGKKNLCAYLNAKSVKCADGEWQKPVVHVDNDGAVQCLDRNATSVTIPEGVTKIGTRAFSGCKSLSSVVIPSSVTEIGEAAFVRCNSLSSVEFGGTVAQWEAVEGKQNLLRYIPATVVKCADGEWQKPDLWVVNGVAFECLDKDATSVVIPEGVTKIIRGAFLDCKSLSSVSIPSSVAEIGEDAFFHCSSLTSIEFGGTAAQWEAVEKVRDWHGGVPARSLKCADGEAEL